MKHQKIAFLVMVAFFALAPLVLYPVFLMKGHPGHWPRRRCRVRKLPGSRRAGTALRARAPGLPAIAK